MRVAAPSPAEQRGAVRRLLDVWGFVPGLRAPHEDVTLVTRDGVRLAASYLHGPQGPGSGGPAVLVAHGFAGHRRKPAYALLAEALARDVAVLTVDLRGHGGSAGRCSLGDREMLDVRAGAAWLRQAGHRWTALVGVSMGASAALRAAGLGPPGLADAVCAISAPAEFMHDHTPAVEALARTMTSTTWRLLAERACHVRIARGWGHPASALSLADRIAPTPVLLVHGRDDHYFGPDHAQRLYAAARPPRELWLEPPGFGHAEDGLSPAFVGRLRAALATVRATGVWPTRDGSPGVGARRSSALS
jgi:uncharacterized protein